MSRATRLARHIERTVTGPMWHGPALVDLLEGVTADAARKRPVAAAHNIWELVLHITAWADIARQRIKGHDTGDPTPEQDWPKPGSDPAWPLAVERLEETHRQLAADTRMLGEAELDALVPGLEYTVRVLLHGIVEHGAYHGGQIALLRRGLDA